MRRSDEESGGVRRMSFRPFSRSVARRGALHAPRLSAAFPAIIVALCVLGAVRAASRVIVSPDEVAASSDHAPTEGVGERSATPADGRSEAPAEGDAFGRTCDAPCPGAPAEKAPSSPVSPDDLPSGNASGSAAIEVGICQAREVKLRPRHAPPAATLTGAGSDARLSGTSQHACSQGAPAGDRGPPSDQILEGPHRPRAPPAA